MEEKEEKEEPKVRIRDITRTSGITEKERELEFIRARDKLMREILGKEDLEAEE